MNIATQRSSDIFSDIYSLKLRLGTLYLGKILYISSSDTHLYINDIYLYCQELIDLVVCSTSPCHHNGVYIYIPGQCRIQRGCSRGGGGRRPSRADPVLDQESRNPRCVSRGIESSPSKLLN